MNPPTQRRPVPLPRATGDRPSSRPGSAQASTRPSSSEGSETSASSQIGPTQTRRPNASSGHTPTLPTFTSARQPSANNSTMSVPQTGQHPRPSAIFMPPNDRDLSHSRKTSPLGPPLEMRGHHRRQHSQGFFEPSLPSASLSDNGALSPNLTASQIAAQAAMQHLAGPANFQHSRRRSQTVPVPQDQGAPKERKPSKGSPSPIQPNFETSPDLAAADQQYRNGLIGTTAAAATAANAAFPRNTTTSHNSEWTEKEGKGKTSKMKLFKPKHIGISRDKDVDRKDKPIPSPNKLGVQASGPLARVANAASTTSLADTLSSGNSSMYNLNNSSTATMVPIEKQADKEKSHKHIFSRKNLKLKDRDEHGLQLSSASSNSRAIDPNGPQPLYSFAPSSPGLNSSFAKSMSGLDLRHPGRALRDRKKEEKVTASTTPLDHVYSRESEASTSEWPTTTSLGTTSSTSFFGPVASNPPLPTAEALQGFGLQNMTPEDAWDFLKAKILVIFEGEDVRMAVEDLNRLVTIHVQHCVRKHAPSVIIEDLNDLCQTGFLSLNHTLRTVPDDRLVPHLVSMWLFVFGTIVPFMQAVFLPLDLEFKGHGVVLNTPAAASEFWGAMPPPTPSNPAYVDQDNYFPQSGTMPPLPPTSMPAGDALDVRHIVLVSFRDTVILPRYSVLKATFSRLSLESINGTLNSLSELSKTGSGSTGGRPNTANSYDQAGSFISTSYNSQSSTLLGTTSSDPASDLSSANRSRATSNVSNVSNVSNRSIHDTFQSFSSPPTATSNSTSSAQVTETVGRMLQCVSVLASVQSSDDAQSRMEELGKELKLNWLGRGRTGRQRRGFVGTRVRIPPAYGVGRDRDDDSRDGSPTPTPTRAGTQKEQAQALGQMRRGTLERL